MLRLEISYTEMVEFRPMLSRHISFEERPIWHQKAQELWIKGKLQKAGFNLNEPVESYQRLTDKALVFEQLEPATPPDTQTGKGEG